MTGHRSRLHPTFRERHPTPQAVCAVLMATLAGCGGDPYAGRYVSQISAPESLIGEWTCTDWTMKPQHTPGPRVARIVLLDDGSFQASDYPGETLDDNLAAGSTLDGAGTWSLEKHQSWQVVRMHWKRLGERNCDVGEMLHILTSAQNGRDAPYVLHQIIGDPDFGEALVFEKRPR